MRERLTNGTRIQCALDANERPMHCHHEKTIVIDDRVAFVGGIDLTAQSGDRFDSSRSPGPRTRSAGTTPRPAIEGPAVADVAEHFRDALARGDRRAAPPPARRPSAAGDVELQIVRTVPEHVYTRRSARRLSHPRVVHAARFRSAQRFIYLENQFLWSPEIARLLREKLVNPPTPDFRVLLVLPASPKSGNDDTRGVLAELIEADGDNGRSSRLRALRPLRAARRPDLRPRQGRDRRRPLADARLGEPERALALQRHRDEHRRPRPGARRSERVCASGRSISSSRRTRSRTIRRRAIDELWKPISKEQLERRTQRRAAHAPARPAAARLATNAAHPRPAQRPRRRRLDRS